MTKKTDISVPEGYFQDLQSRLSDIPKQDQSPRGIRKAYPYLAYAASLLALLWLGNAILRQTAVTARDDAEWDYITCLAPSLDPDGGLIELGEMEELTEDDIVSFLIADNLSVEQVNEMYYEKTE